jgi:GT2 family glycosyltransferase/glycosyltransferase involved in cell wall biosynthesis
MTADLNERRAAAWRNGMELARKGDTATALLWLERAARLAPRDPRIALDLANLRIAAGGFTQLQAAAPAFEALAVKYDIAAAWLGLLTVKRRLGDHAGAAAALKNLLQRHCVPEDPAFAPVASLIAADAGFNGWSGLRPDGKIHREGGGKLGPPFDKTRLQKVEGIVSVVESSLAGWATRLAAPGAPPSLTLTDSAGRTLPISFGKLLPGDEAAPFAQRHGFAIPAPRLAGFQPPFRLTGPTGHDIFGSPVDPLALAAVKPVPATFQGPPITTLPARARIAVVMPVYRGLAVTRAAMEAVLEAAPGAEIIAVDDATPEPALAAWLDTRAAEGRILLIRHDRNQGFPAAVNTGLAAAAGCDVLLLNSDTIMPPGALEALTDAVYAAPDIGTATPFSNDATILNVPNPFGRNDMPDAAETARLQRFAAAANPGVVIEIPTAIGFCMFIRHDCLAAAGPLRAGIFAQGYGEENDFCLRARHAGYRHVAAAGAYVAHRGGVSFGAAGRALNARNAAILERLHPGYDALIAAHIAADPLAPARYRLDVARFTAARSGSGAVLLISHDHGGGVARIVARDMQAIRDSGRRPLLLSPTTWKDPEKAPFPWDSELTDGKPGDYPNLRFTLPGQFSALIEVLRGENIHHVVLHHSLGHHPAIRGIAAALGVPQDLVTHDYSSFCPRINLLTRHNPGDPLRFCGEPNLAGCTACYDAIGGETFEFIPPAALVDRSAAEFAAARRIIAPSPDAARRLARHFPKLRAEVTPWEDDEYPVKLTRPKTGARNIVIVGGIGPAKGYDILLDCARDAVRRRLALKFMIAGPSADDAPLLDTGLIFITGPYQEGEAEPLIKSLNADLAFLPSIWPETWCFALSEAWRAGLYTLAFDLGAQADRIRATNRGAVLPLGLPVPRINDALLAWQPSGI